MREPPGTATALLLTALVLVVGFVLLRAYEARFQPRLESPDPYVVPFYGPSQINSWVLLIAPLYDSRGQRLAHLAMTALAAVLFVLAPITGAAGRVADRVARGVAFLATSAVVLAVVRDAADPVSLTIGAALVVGLALGACGLNRRLVNRTMAALVGLVILGATLPGWLVYLNLTNAPAASAWVQWHYSTVLGPADLLAAGWRLGEEVPTVYGLLLPVLAAGYQRHRAALDMGDYVRVIEALQLLLFLVCAWLYHRHGRGRWVSTPPRGPWEGKPACRSWTWPPIFEGTRGSSTAT